MTRKKKIQLSNEAITALGKWLLDIAKYVVTAIVIASLIGMIQSPWLIYSVSLIVAIISLMTGLNLVSKGTESDKKERE